MSEKHIDSITVKLTKRQCKKLKALSFEDGVSRTELVREYITLTEDNSVKTAELVPLVTELSAAVYDNNIYANNVSVNRYITKLNEMVIERDLEQYISKDKKYVKKMTIPLTDAEKTMIKRRAAQRGVSESKYARMMIFCKNEYISKRRLLPILEELNYCIRKMELKGRNISEVKVWIIKIWKLL